MRRAKASPRQSQRKATPPLRGPDQKKPCRPAESAPIQQAPHTRGCPSAPAARKTHENREGFLPLGTELGASLLGIEPPKMACCLLILVSLQKHTNKGNGKAHPLLWVHVGVAQQPATSSRCCLHIRVSAPQVVWVGGWVVCHFANKN